MNDITLNRRLASLNGALSPILPFLKNDRIIEIMLNPHDGQIWVEEVGKGMYKPGVVMTSAEAETVARLVAAAHHTEINEHRPRLSGKLPGYGARVQVSVPPIVESPSFSFRKPSKVVFSLADYVAAGIMTEEQGEVIAEAVKEQKNILVGGGTSSGKTTLANALLKVVAETEDRVYVMEDNLELQCTSENRVQVLVQPPLYTWQEAVMDALRYRPDRIIVGEVRDGSALDLLKGWNTGHPGGIATIHANNPPAMLDRLVQLIEEVVPRASRELIAEAIDLCVHMKRDRNHPAGRCLSGIARVEGVSPRGEWQLETII